MTEELRPGRRFINAFWTNPDGKFQLCEIKELTGWEVFYAPVRKDGTLGPTMRVDADNWERRVKEWVS